MTMMHKPLALTHSSDRTGVSLDDILIEGLFLWGSDDGSQAAETFPGDGETDER